MPYLERAARRAGKHSRVSQRPRSSFGQAADAGVVSSIIMLGLSEEFLRGVMSRARARPLLPALWPEAPYRWSSKVEIHNANQT